MNEKRANETAKPGDSTSPDASLDFPADWKLETGVYSRDINARKLKKLDVGDLSIAQSAIRKVPGGGFNPYDNSTQGAHPDPYSKPRARATHASKGSASTPAATPALKKPVRPVPVVAASRPSALARLGSWLKRDRKSDDDDYE